MSGLSPVTRKLLAVTLLVLLVFGAWSLVAEPILARHDLYRQQIEETEALRARYRSVIGTEAALRRELALLEETATASGGLLEADSPNLGAADIQTQIKAFVDASGASLKSMGNVPPESREGFQRVATRVNVVSDTRALQQVLHDIETARPYLFVDNLSVRARNRRARRNGEGDAAAEQLQVGFDVYGFIQADPQ